MSRERGQRKKRRAIQTRPMTPVRSVIVITETGPREFSSDEISTELIGQKAYGITSIPSEWVPPFFVVTASCLEAVHSTDVINKWITECLEHIGISRSRQVMVRSSGTTETMNNRGQLVSALCSQDDILPTIRNLIPQLPAMADSNVHWIIQEHIYPLQKGHLSNERRLREEKRDWVAEIEHQGENLGFTVSMAVRPWRDGMDVPDLNLRCNSEFEVTLCLKKVAMWATWLSSRTHFEWVWDGKAVHIVQADKAEITNGIKPLSLLPDQIPTIELANLTVFHAATDKDYEQYGKLRNAKLYRQLGYKMPVFFVADDPVIVENILAGEIPTSLAKDLEELTKRPLIIRTDGRNIPDDKREMLPRSDELRSYIEARDWLLNNFTFQINQGELGSSDLCLIAHHFIPSVASAWARAEPRKRMVRVESLWGIPDGLYWHSHDTSEVDTLKVDIEFGRPNKPLHYRSHIRRRYKGTFIGPDKEGKWIPYQTVQPYDWKKCIDKQEWLFEIANVTRQIAEHEGNAVSVMWFIKNHPQATEHKVLPWFHIKSELTSSPKAAPRRKLRSAKDVKIEGTDDWKKLQDDIASGKRVERVIVEPTDPDLIRNRRFVEDLAALAVSREFVVELSGGILSHAYYILQRSGARVECIDLFGASEEVLEFNKIVRDKVPELIESGGERVVTVQLAGEALIAALRKKLIEEALEALDARTGADLVSELADIQEVIIAISQVINVSLTQIEAEREEKRNRRGAFDKGLMLIKTAMPHSIQKQAAPPPAQSLTLTIQEAPETIISDVTDLPSKPLYRRPDLRQVDKLLEKLFTFETEINTTEPVKATLDFPMPMDEKRERELSLTIELQREHSSLRGRVTLRLLPSQLQIEFPE